MKIHLVNFRCYEDKTFDFGDNGLVLISASSGAGKSTILSAIQFALFGTGTKVSSYGKTSCKVELEFDNMKIVRTKRPNRLIINDEYEDNEAQEIINKIFGDTFDVTGYISQNALNSFIIMSPTEKLEFLEKFAFKNVNLSEIKNRCKSLVSQRNDNLNKTITQLEMTSSIFKELKEPEVVKFPLKGKESLYEKIHKNEEIKKKNCDTLIKRSKNVIETSQKEISDIRVLQTFLYNKEENINDLIDKLDNIKIEKENITYKGDEQLEKYKKILKIILSQKELSILEDRYDIDKDKLDKLKQNEFEKLNKELETLENDIWKEYNEDELKTNIKDTKDSLKDAKRISFLKKELKDYIVDEKELDKDKKLLFEYKNNLEDNIKLKNTLKQYKTIHSCPSCNSKLQIREDKIYIVNDIPELKVGELENVIKEIAILEKDISQLQNKIQDGEHKIKRKIKLEKDIEEILSQYEEELEEGDIEDSLEYLENYLKAEKVKEKRYNQLKQKIETGETSIYGELENDLQILEKKINKLRDISEELEEDYEEEELRKLITEEEKNRDSIKKIKINISKLEDEKMKNEIQIKEMKDKHISKYKDIKSEKELNIVITENKDKIVELENKKTEHEMNLENIKKYYEYIKEKENYDSWKVKVTNLEVQEKEDRNKYTASLLLKEKILEAESIALANIIDSINTHAQIYLDSFFIDNPIVVRLLPFKETKKSSKPQINIEILYKEMECDLNMLSGGELSRVILAFTLALGEMFNTPILMLDESTASLDQDATTVVFDSIKENFKGKIVLIIAHQVIQGVFDKIIKL